MLQADVELFGGRGHGEIERG
ncbi:hypothetical protein CCP3SC1AL1_4250003 [Gammaproteobacteria bacterium]